MPTFSPLMAFPMPTTRDASMQEMGTGRPVGRHLSEITRERMIASKGAYNVIEGEAEWLRAQTGFLWEMALEYQIKGLNYQEAMEAAWKELHQLTRKVDKQIRLELDGILGTPDGLNQDDRMLEEYKFTWQSANKWGLLPGPPGFILDKPKSKTHQLYSEEDQLKVLGKADPESNFGEWITRSAGYLKMFNSSRPCLGNGCTPGQEEHCDHLIYQVRFIIFWVNGDYSYQKGRGPQPTECIITFTPEELDDDWETTLTYNSYMLEEGR